jgi:hypothetical protein
MEAITIDTPPPSQPPAQAPAQPEAQVAPRLVAHKRLLAFINAMSEIERERFAVRCGTTVGYLRKAVCVGQELGESLSVRIETHTQDAISVRELRPDLADALERAGYVRASPAIRAYIAKANRVEA